MRSGSSPPTGTWEGSASNAEGASWFQFNLAQQGSQVKGTVRGTGLNRSAGEVNGTVTGDVFNHSRARI